LQAGALTSATAVVSDQVLPRLDVAQSDGWAKVLRKAAVITANGTEATFTGGGEVNVPVTGGFGGTIKQIRFGSEIGVKPRYDKQSGRIELQITADVSDLTADNGTGVPGRTVSTLSTIVNLELGQSLALAGLTAASESSDHTGLPGLSQIPIIGLLFGTHGSRTAHTENVVFIVPTVIDTVSMQKRALIDEAVAAYEGYDGDLDEAPALMPERTGK
jgi:pilus assembly protein CpaC